jgi:hypothetical protein
VIGPTCVSAGVSRFTYHAPLDPDCPDVRSFHESQAAVDDPRFLRRRTDLVAEFERRHRAECEQCHVYGAVHMEVRDATSLS